ncbi:hypothetical protein TWF694_008954 [Orbilia ellipsospora]|uniref:NmrA-like domain-containing protein n=1 Tax=Orbilia ellipsospora TaxID=2528407 RepID=A0AAV9XEV8_9PEZI
MMHKILITDAVGLVGAYIIDALLELPGLQPQSPEEPSSIILAGYHSPADLSIVRDKYQHQSVVVPTLVDWANETAYSDAVKNIDYILLLTPFTANKVEQINSWMSAISTASSNRSIHIVHIGVHTDETIDPTKRPPHETWQLQAEQVIRSICLTNENLTSTFLRINFDGYNTLLRPLKVAYFIPRDTRFGWAAREDIAKFAATILTSHPAHHDRKTYVISTEAISLVEMAAMASDVINENVQVEELGVAGFEDMALAAQPGDEGYAAYIRSVAEMFRGLQRGEYGWHKDVFPGIFEEIVGRKALSFAEWLAGSATRSRLMLK